MTPEEVLNQLYRDRKEIWEQATRRYALGIDVPYPKELEEIDKQIEKIEPLVSPLHRYPRLSGGGIEPAYNYYPDQNLFSEKRSVFLEQQHREKLQRESLKLQRIIASQEDKRVHALNKILEHAELYPEQTCFNIDYYDFNYEDRMDHKNLLDRFFETAKVAGCFKGFSSRGRVNGRDYGFQEINIGNIKKFINSLSEKKGLKENKIRHLQTPLILGKNEDIYIHGKSNPILQKAGNKAYWFIRGCIEKSNDDYTIDIDSIYKFLLQNNDSLQVRFKIKPNLTTDAQWRLIHTTFHNIKRSYIKDLEKYLIKNQKQVKNLQWKV